jgi:hypothetical protein
MSGKHDNSVNQRSPQIFKNFAGITSLELCLFGDAAFSVSESVCFADGFRKYRRAKKRGLTAQHNAQFTPLLFNRHISPPADHFL